MGFFETLAGASLSQLILTGLQLALLLPVASDACAALGKFEEQERRKLQCALVECLLYLCTMSVKTSGRRRR